MATTSCRMTSTLKLVKLKAFESVALGDAELQLSNGFGNNLKKNYKLIGKIFEI
jgi:hypothetical protein